MRRLRTVRMDLLTSKEIAEYIKTEKLAILPIGCTEMHGPMIPMGCDTFLDTAIALILGEKWNCPVLPTIPYIYPGASGPWPGTINISPEASTAYITAVAQAAIKTGFKHLVIMGSHGPLLFMAPSVIRSIYQETGNIVAYMFCYDVISNEIEKEFGRRGEDICILGAMKILGLNGYYQPETKVDLKQENPEYFGLFQNLDVKVPWVFDRDHQHTGIRADLKTEDAERAANCIQRALERYNDFPKMLCQYHNDMEKLKTDPPWERDNIWSS